MVVARSRAEMPEPLARRAVIGTVKAVPSGAWLSPTIMLRPSWSIRSGAIGRQIRPRPCLAMKLMASVRGQLGGHAEVALVFALLVIHQDDHAAAANLFERFLDRDERGLALFARD